MTDNDTRYEYRVIRLKRTFIGGIADDALQTALNDAGREGWAFCRSCTQKTPISACTWCSSARAELRNSANLQGGR